MCNCGNSHDNHENCCGEGCGGECQCGEECGGGCKCDNRSFRRRFQTKAEQIVELESYLNELKKEVQAVEEMLADLQK